MRSFWSFAVFGLVACGSSELPSASAVGSVRSASAPAVRPAEATFASSYGELFCQKTTACNPSLSCSPVVVEKAGCAFDAAAAAECLSGTWSCDTQFAGYEYALAPAACARVWDCAVASR